tara:strand:+ start:8182 stop:8604 length:423 start_codon:yes stop_codon:yes gene_type:complete
MNIKALLILAVFIAASCRSNDDDMVESTCNAIEINSDLFNNGITDEFEILEASVTNDCLVILLRYGGGCGEIDATLVLGDGGNSNVLQRNARVIFVDEDNCEALLSKEYSFDLTSLQDNSTNSIEIILQDFPDNPIVYEY